LCHFLFSLASHVCRIRAFITLLAARAQQPAMNSSSVWDETTVPISHRHSGVA
jgi:hypothetical protein